VNFAQAQRRAGKNLTGIGVVILLHVLLAWAVTSGLARKVVDVVRAPIETKVVEEIKKPPPPPDLVVPPPPRLEAPPPPFIPPPEVQVATPPVETAITAVTPTPPPAPVAIAPLAPPVTAPPAPPQPAVMSAAVVCSNYTTVMGDAGFPREAARQGIDKGEAVIQFTLSANGDIRDVKALRASHPIFARNSIRIVSEYKCQGQGRDVVVQVPFGYKLD
jgi:periplasmic protein TonB